jgi:hypothetical protein
MISLTNDCEEYFICGCRSVTEDLHCMYCCEPPQRHSARSLHGFLASEWDMEEKRAVAAAVGWVFPGENPAQ